MQSRIRTAAIVMLLVLTPFLLRWMYLAYTKLPEQITMATGPINGEWHALSHDLSQAIESRCGVKVQMHSEFTEGALHHLKLLDAKDVDFALYLRGSRRRQPPEASFRGPAPMFVGNLYSDITFFLVRRELYEAGSLLTPADLGKRQDDGTPYRVAVGRPQTGEHSIAQVILNYYFGEQRETLEEFEWDYSEVEEGFNSGTLDAAFMSVGHQAPIFGSLIEQEPGLCVVGQIPEVDAIVMRNVGLGKVQIPPGLFRFDGKNIPERAVDSVASQTTLLTHEDTSSQMVEEVTRILLSEDFIQDNQLFELSRQGTEFASNNPEFEIHPGAMAVYDPRLKPLVDPDFMEATENLRSFGVSLLIAGFLAYQWYRRHAERRKDHRLDEYFAELLKIDRAAAFTIRSDQDAIQLQQTLEHVVELRNEALGEFSAQDFDEDSAADSFLFLCETVAADIRSRLLRREVRTSISKLTESFKSSTAPPSEPAP